MKVAIVSEWTADEAAISILLPAIVNCPVELVPMKSRPRGWTQLVQFIPAIVQEVYYSTDADGLVVVLDSDFTVVHSLSHELPGKFDVKCRLCTIFNSAREKLGHLVSRANPRPSAKPLHLACGLAVPSIEAWYLCGVDHQVSEATWNNAVKQKKIPYKPADLKFRTYGSERITIGRSQQVAEQHAARQADAKGIELLKQTFPDGFGTLVRLLQTWAVPTPKDPPT